MKSRTVHTTLVLVTVLALLAAPVTVVFAGTFGPVAATDQTPTAPLANPDPTSFQPRYISGFGSNDAFTVFFEDRDAAQAISYASTTTGPTGFPASVTATNISDTHFCVKDWPINIGGTDYAYRAWASHGNDTQHEFYVSNDLSTWALVSTFTIPNAPGFTDAHGWVYYGFHDVIQLNGTYYAFAESNQSQTMIVRSANGDDVWEAFASIGGRPGWGPLELPAGVSSGWTPSGSFVDLGHDRGYGKIYVDPRDSDFYLAVNTAAKPSLPPADLEAAFIDPANWTWHDGTTGPAANPILSGTTEHDLRECWVVPNSDPDGDWVIVYDADFGSGDGGKALGYATLTPPTPPPDIVYVHENADATVCTAEGHTWQVDCFDVIQDGIDAVAAGGTVMVGPGTYDAGKETFPINVDKSVTLQGPQADVDPRPSAGSTRTPGDASTEAVIDGGNSVSRILYIDADDVLINGLEVKSGTGDMIRQSDAHSGTVVKYSIIHDGNGDEGVQLKECTDCTLEFNYVYDIATPGDALNISDGCVNGMIRFNELHDIASENAAIYVYGSTNTAIQCNLVYDVPENDGIKLGSKNGADASLTGGSIRYNVVHDTAQDGIAVYTSETLVDGNEVYHSASENGAIYLAYDISNIMVVDNDIHDNTLDPGKWGDPGAVMIGMGVNAGTVHVNNNNITSNSVNGVTNKATAPLDAEDNWWGAADGPSGAGSGSGDPVSTNVDFDPWLIAPAVPQGTNPCVGTITIVKDADPADGTDFSFDGGCGLGTFTLDDADPDDGDGYASAMTFAMPPGTYTVVEIVPSGWKLDTITCISNDPNDTTATQLGDKTATIDLDLGEEIACTFANSRSPVRPILECVVNNQDGTYTAHFGYLNENDAAVEIPVGPRNKFTGGGLSGQDQGQPTTFQPGRTPYWPNAAFTVDFDGSNLVWTLDGRTSTASSGSQPCSYHIFIEKEWVDEEGQPLDAPPDELSDDFAITAVSSLGTATCSYPTDSSDLVCVYDNDHPALDDIGLWVPVGTTFEVTEDGLGDWVGKSGLGTAVVDLANCGIDGFDKYCRHTVVNEPGEPSAVTLLSFIAEVDRSGVTLAWETGTEIDNAGFNLYRATSPDGPWTKVNGALIAAQGDPVSGASYSFVDRGLAPGTYLYELEDVEFSGLSTRHGPVSATVRPRFRRPPRRPRLPGF